MADKDVLTALTQVGLKGKALEKGQEIVAAADQGETPDPKTYEKSREFISSFEKKMDSKPEFQAASPQAKAALVQNELQDTAKESMSNRELVGRLLIGFVPTLLGAAIGGATGMGVGLGGVAGGEASLAGLKQIDELKKAQEAKKEKATEEELKRLKLKQDLGKESKEDERKRIELELKAREVSAKEKEAGLKGQAAPKGFERKINPETGQPEFMPLTQKLPPDKVMAISEFQSIPQLITDLRSSIEANKELFGPARGRVLSMLPIDVVNTLESQVRNVRQTIGKLKEGGVLRVEDEVKYQKMLPALSDNPDVALSKLELVEREMGNKYNNTVSSLDMAGYDVRPFKGQMAAPPELPAILKTQKQGFTLPGQIKESVAAEQPPTVVQNGHTYTWNPATKRYE